MLFSCSSVAQAKVAAQQAQSALPCQLSEADKVANAELSVPQFDYTPSSSTNARSLANRGCYREAAEAGQDYLAKRQIGDERAHSNVIFHIGQNLAMSGDERAAAMMIAAAKRPSQPADASFDWNTYVFGTWAFLQRNRALLQSSYDVLSAKEAKGIETSSEDSDLKMFSAKQSCNGPQYGPQMLRLHLNKSAQAPEFLAGVLQPIPPPLSQFRWSRPYPRGHPPILGNGA